MRDLLGRISALRLSPELSSIRTSTKGGMVQGLGNMFSRIAALPVWAKALLVLPALVVLGLSASLSTTLVMILVLLVLIVAWSKGKRRA